MQRIHRILVAIKDPALPATPALFKAVQLARLLNARLDLFHALSEPLYADSFIHGGRGLLDVQRDLQSRAVQRLEAMAERLRGRGSQRVLQFGVAAEWDWPSYEAVVRRAQASKADLIVADRHTGSHLGRALLHLTDWELLRRSSVPVLLVNRARAYRRPRVLAALDPAHLEKPPGLDADILQLGESLSHALGGRLYALHAYAPLPPDTRPADILDPKRAARVRAGAAATARRRLEHGLRRTRIARARRLVIGLPPADAIEETANSLRSQMVVIGAVARSGLQRLLIGNTAERVLDRLACDLLVVKPRGFKARVARETAGVRLVPATPLLA